MNPALILIALVMILILYLPVIVKLARQWLGDSNYRHGLLIPIVSAIALWKKRDFFRHARVGGDTFSGLLLMAASSVLLIGGTAASELFTARLSLPVFLIGATLFIFGRAITAAAIPSLLFLFMMIPLPYIIYYKVTFPLQLLSARLAAGALGFAGVSVIREGNILYLPNYALEVVAACSGLRSLMTMLTLALVFAMFSTMSPIKKLLLSLSAVPIAVAANVVRLTVTALGAYTIGPQFADGTIHEISGLIVFVTGFILLMITAGILKWIKLNRRGPLSS